MPAETLASPPLPVREIASKARMMPITVPNKPTNGLMFPSVASDVRRRSSSGPPCRPGLADSSGRNSRRPDPRTAARYPPWLASQAARACSIFPWSTRSKTRRASVADAIRLRR
jgi:hypothetical protein